MHGDDEAPPTPEEQREAAALARMLEGDSHEADALPSDIAETANFFSAHREGRQGPTLEPDNTRLDAIRRKVWEENSPQDTKAQSRRPWWFFGGLGTLAATGALAVLLLISPKHDARMDSAAKEVAMSPAPAAPPPPAGVNTSPSAKLAPRKLLAAQRQALTDTKAPLDDLHREMSTYRNQLLEQWSAKYAPHAGATPLGPERFAAR